MLPDRRVSVSGSSSDWDREKINCLINDQLWGRQQCDLCTANFEYRSVVTGGCAVLSCGRARCFRFHRGLRYSQPCQLQPDPRRKAVPQARTRGRQVGRRVVHLSYAWQIRTQLHKAIIPSPYDSLYDNSEKCTDPDLLTFTCLALI